MASGALPSTRRTFRLRIIDISGLRRALVSRQGINSTKSVLFTLLGCLQMARPRFDTRVLGTSGSSKKRITIYASPSALNCHLCFRRIQILDQIRRRLFECGRLWSKGSRMLQCSQYMIRCHDLRCRHPYVLFPTLLPTDMNDVFLSNAWPHFWTCTLTCYVSSCLRRAS